MKDPDFDFGRLTVRAFGPVVKDEDRDGGLSLADEVQAQIERPVQDVDDLDELTFNDRDPRNAIDAVVHLLDDNEDLRLAKDPGDRADMALDWTITVDGPVAAWVDLAEANDIAGVRKRNAEDYLDDITMRDTVGPNAYLAALQVGQDATGINREAILERYQDATGLGDDDD